ncbi:hypothetical protein CFIMG_003236RA [Ceratocystis fimbriata CBS 114723]|uniref:PNPLA domain-containing protein n=1 Tax=Ceratocystis fimbriata CBS 114723 TaxID=1035309 RepID=A0A2C5X0R8_9PEZI|nr:hypothetical protein CFIMG_003236RA [Ceratocystis fimbriata CBS 114723]
MYRDVMTAGYATSPAPATPSGTVAVPRNLLSLDGGGLQSFSSVVFLHELMLEIQKLQDLKTLPSPCRYFHLIGGTGVGGVLALILGQLQLSTQDLLDVCRENWVLPIYRESRFFTHLFKRCQARVNDRRPSASHRIRPPLTNSHVLRASLQGLGLYSHDMQGLAPVPETPEHDGGFVHDTRCFAVARSCDAGSETPILFRSYGAPSSAIGACPVTQMDEHDEDMQGPHHSDSPFSEDYFSQAAKCVVDVPFQFPRRPNRAIRSPDIIDGSSMWCNPSELLLREANGLFGSDGRLGVLVSMGAEPNPSLGWRVDARAVHSQIERRLEEQHIKDDQLGIQTPRQRRYFRLSDGSMLPQTPVELITHSAILEVLSTAEAWVEDNHAVIEELAQAVTQALNAEDAGGPAFSKIVPGLAVTNLETEKKPLAAESRKDSLWSHNDASPLPMMPESSLSTTPPLPIPSLCSLPSSIGRPLEIGHSSLLNAARENSSDGRSARTATRLLHILSFLAPKNIAPEIIALAASSQAVRQGETAGHISLTGTNFPMALFTQQPIDHVQRQNSPVSSLNISPEPCTTAFAALENLGLLTAEQQPAPNWPQPLTWFSISPDMQRHVRLAMGSSQLQESLWAASTIVHYSLATPSRFPFFLAQRWLPHCYALQRHTAELFKRGTYTEYSDHDSAVQSTVRAQLFAACGFAPFAAAEMPDALAILYQNYAVNGKQACLDVALQASLLYADILLQANRPVESAYVCEEARQRATEANRCLSPSQISHKLGLALRAKEICARLLAGDKESVDVNVDLDISAIRTVAIENSSYVSSATDVDVGLLLDIAYAYALLRDFSAAMEVGNMALQAVEHCAVDLSGPTLAVYRKVAIIEAQSGRGIAQGQGIERLRRAVYLTKDVVLDSDAEILRTQITLAELALLKVEAEKMSRGDDEGTQNAANTVVSDISKTYQACRRRFGPRSPLARQALRIMCDALHASGDIARGLKMLDRFHESCSEESPAEEVDTIIALRIRSLPIEMSQVARAAEDQLADLGSRANAKACLERLEFEYRCWMDLDSQLMDAGDSLPRCGQAYYSRVMDSEMIEEAIETISKEIEAFDMAEAVERHLRILKG